MFKVGPPDLKLADIGKTGMHMHLPGLEGMELWSSLLRLGKIARVHRMVAHKKPRSPWAKEKYENQHRRQDEG